MLATGAVVTAVALAPPVDDAAARDLALHMGQHIALVSLAAPLLAAGVRARRDWATRPWPALAVIAQVGTLWCWHAPGPFDAALRNAPLHAVEHLCLLTTSVWFWMTVMAMARRPVPGAGALAVVVAAVTNTMLGAAITLWPRALYAGAPLTDQQLAGVVMWAGGGSVYVVTLAALFHRWLATEVAT